MANILLLGAGFVTAPLVEYLHKKRHHLTIASQFLEEAENLVAGRENLTPEKVDVTNQEQLLSFIHEADLVISFVPFQFHVAVAKLCIAEKKPMVTASYTSDEMWSLDEQAKAAGVILLNEVGVDPGIDHMTAMQVIDEAREKGQNIEAFVSWCGGIPAPEASDNPLGYKFSWSPMAVLSAVSNDAKYLSQGKERSISSEDLLSSMRDITCNNLELRGYANRDSLIYKQAYQIPEVKTLLRGTLRYPGFGKVIDTAKKIGLLDSTDFTGSDFTSEAPQTWAELMSQLADLPQEKLVSELTGDQQINDSFNWLGCFSQEPVKDNSPISAFCSLLTEKLKYADDEQDMIAMQHRIVLNDGNGNKVFHRSTLIEKGDKGGFSAMAKTVGYPAAIAADLILSNKINRQGVCIPVSKDIYQPILVELSDLGINMHDEIVADQTENDFLNNL